MLLQLNIECDKNLDLAELVLVGMMSRIGQEKEIQEGKESQGKVSKGGGGTDIIVDGIRAFIIHHESKGQT
jgi:hypothetical protein